MTNIYIYIYISIYIYPFHFPPLLLEIYFYIIVNIVASGKMFVHSICIIRSSLS